MIADGHVAQRTRAPFCGRLCTPETTWRDGVPIDEIDFVNDLVYQREPQDRSTASTLAQPMPTADGAPC